MTTNAEIVFCFDHTKLTVGAHFFEDGYGLQEFVVTKAAELSTPKEGLEGKRQLRWSAVRVGEDPSNDSSVIPFLITEGFEHYGPKIYLPDEIIEIDGRKFSAR